MEVDIPTQPSRHVSANLVSVFEIKQSCYGKNGRLHRASLTKLIDEES